MAFSPYSTVTPFLSGSDRLTWYPPEHRDRVASYEKYDQLYWNDEEQFSLRVLEGEQAVHVPNPRTIVDTTAYYLLKGLSISAKDPEANVELAAALKAFMDREMFLARFQQAKHAGVARGDFCIHLTADPAKVEGERLSVNPVYPGNVIPVYDPEDIDKLLRVHLIDLWVDPNDPTRKQYLKKLTYEYEGDGEQKRVYREEAIYSLDEEWWGQRPKLLKKTLPRAVLPDPIRTIPIYWFKNVEWGEQEFGSSELRGFERISQGISQAATDQEAALSLEGLGVYATDGGRPVDDNGVEVDWEVAPGKVMEVPTGSYFRRVEGVGSLKPSMDHINYLESKIREAGGLSDVALGRVDVATAQSGIALAIKFIPTLAKIEERDLYCIGKLKQFFYDWKLWFQAYERGTLDGDIDVAIGEKLPQNRTERINELNNMFDRDIIPAAFYRAEMQKLGYIFPDNIQKMLDDEAQKRAEQAAATAPPGLQPNAAAAARGDIPPPPPGSGRSSNTLPPPPNKSNNKGKPNESAGTEATQPVARQARGGKPQ